VRKASEPEPKWSLRSSAFTGCLAGLAVADLHHVDHVISNDIPDSIYTHVIGETIAAAAGGVILFGGVAAYRNWLRAKALDQEGSRENGRTISGNGADFTESARTAPASAKDISLHGPCSLHCGFR